MVHSSTQQRPLRPREDTTAQATSERCRGAQSVRPPVGPSGRAPALGEDCGARGVQVADLGVGLWGDGNLCTLSLLVAASSELL